jgi:hypothetical protein
MWRKDPVGEFDIGKVAANGVNAWIDRNPAARQ